MPVAPSYPGVYIEEIPSGVHAIAGVSTAVTAFLGNFAQGPMNLPVTVFSVADVERGFGPLASNSEAGYAVRQFFANGGAQAVIVRVAGGSGTNAAAKASVALEDATPTAVLTAVAASEGLWGESVRIAVDHGTTDPAKRFNLTVVRVDASTPPVALATESYLNLSMDPSDANYAVAVVNDASSLVRLSQVNPPSPPAVAGMPVPTGTVSGDLSALVPSSTHGEATTVSLDGVALGTLTVTATPQSLTELAGVLQAALRALTTASATAPLAAATVQVVNGPGTERHLQISALLPTSHSLLGFADGAGQTLAGTLALNGVAGNVQQYALGDTTAAGSQTGGTRGSDGLAGGVPDAASLLGDPQARTGIYALETAQFNLLCLPDTSGLSDSDAFAVISAATVYCRSRWAFLLVDPPQLSTDADGAGRRDSLVGIQDWLATSSTLRSSYAAVYYPRPRIPDPLNGFRLRSVAASGTIAGLYARTDTERGVWKAPAGTTATLVNVAAPAYRLTDAENGTLNPLGINCLRSLPVYGNVCWGARTLEGADQLASDWKYVPVRRLALYLEASLYHGTQWVVFEPNDEPLWSQIRLNVGTFLQQLFEQGALQGSTPAAAYFVRCDSTTTTQADVDQGVVNIVVGFAPLKPAEFVVLQIQQIAGQTSS
jgi:phage tail sheath protein FI